MEYKYWAFLSYSRQDNMSTRGDKTSGWICWSDWLHEALETWDVPAEALNWKTRTGEPMPKRFSPVFQDEKELPLDSNLATSIRTALEESRFLIVLCSPRSARSFYVNEEVRYFKQLGRGDRILGVILDGEPNSSEGKAGYLPEEECFCLALRRPVDSTGQIVDTQREPQEPIAGDLRWKMDVRPREARQSDLRQHRSVLERTKLKLLAGLMGVGFDDLVHREKMREAEQARARAIRHTVLGAIIFVLLAGAAVTTFFWYRARIADAQDKLAAANQHEQAVKNAEAAAQNEAADREHKASLYEQKGQKALTENDAASAAAYLVEAWKLSPNRPELRFLTGLALQPLVGRRTAIDGTGGAVTKVRWGPDGKTIASADEAGTVSLRDAATEKLLVNVSMNENAYRKVFDLQYTPDGKTLVASNDDGALGFFDLSDPTKPKGFFRKASGSGPVALAINRDGTLLATADRGIKLWHLPDATNTVSFGPATPATSICFSKDEKQLLVADQDGGVQLADIDTQQSRAFQADGWLTQAIFSPDEHSIWATGEAEILVAWDIASGTRTKDAKPVDQIPGTDVGLRRVVNLALSQRGETLMLAAPTLISTTSLISGAGHYFALQPVSSSLNTARFSADGKYIVSCPTEGELTGVWETATGAKVASLTAQGVNISDAAFSPDGDEVATGEGNRLVIWDWKKIQMTPPLPAHEGDVLRTAFCGTDSIVTETASTLRIWRKSDATVLKKVQLSLFPESSIAREQSFNWAVSRGEAHVAIGGGDGDVRLYDGNTGAEGPVIARGSQRSSLDFSPDGKLLAAASSEHNNATVSVIDSTSGQATDLPQKFDDVICVRFSPRNGLLLVMTSIGAPTLWDVSKNAMVNQFKTDAGYSEHCLFSPDGTQLLIETSDETIRSWDTINPRIQYTLGPFPQAPRLMRYSDDGKLLAVVTMDSTTHLYDAATGTQVNQWQLSSSSGSVSVPSDLEFWPGTHYVVETRFDSIFVYDPDKGDEIARIPGGGILGNIHFTPDGTGVLVSEGKSARIISLIDPSFNLVSAEEKVSLLDKWRVSDSGSLIER